MSEISEFEDDQKSYSQKLIEDLYPEAKTPLPVKYSESMIVTSYPKEKTISYSEATLPYSERLPMAKMSFYPDETMPKPEPDIIKKVIVQSREIIIYSEKAILERMRKSVIAKYVNPEFIRPKTEAKIFDMYSIEVFFDLARSNGVSFNNINEVRVAFVHIYSPMGRNKSIRDQACCIAGFENKSNKFNFFGGKIDNNSTIMETLYEKLYEQFSVKLSLEFWNSVIKIIRKGNILIFVCHIVSISTTTIREKIQKRISTSINEKFKVMSDVMNLTFQSIRNKEYDISNLIESFTSDLYEIEELLITKSRNLEGIKVQHAFDLKS
jgi:hypothetical protein